MRMLSAAAAAVVLIVGAACSTNESVAPDPVDAPVDSAVPDLIDDSVVVPRGPVIDIETFTAGSARDRRDVHELTYADVTGAERTIVIEVRRPASNRTTSPVVVWSHGGSTGKKSPGRVGQRWGAALNQADFVFVAIAHPGRSGESRRALCTALDVESCGEFKYLLWDRLRDAQVVFDWLEEAVTAGDLFVDLDRLVYGGHSAGALAVMVMAGLESPYRSGVPMPTDARPAAFLVASPPGAEVGGFDASSMAGLDRPMLLLTGDGDTTGGTQGADRLALFDLIDADDVMLISTESKQVGHTTFDLNVQPCIRAGGSKTQCRETVRALAKTAELFLRAALGAGGLDAELLTDRVAGRLPSHMDLLSAAR